MVKWCSWLWLLGCSMGMRVVGGLKAIITSTLGEISGSIGNVTFARNKGGLYMRARATPTNPNTARQQTTRAWVGYCSSYWSTSLTEAERAQWVEYAQTHTWTNRLGQEVYLTGLDWFTMVNTRLLDVGDTVRDAPGDLTTPDGLLTFAVTFTDATTISVAFTSTLPSGGRLEVWGSGPLTAGQDPNMNQCRLIGRSAADATTPASMTLPYTVADEQYVKFYGRVMGANGMCSVPLSDREQYNAV